MSQRDLAEGSRSLWLRPKVTDVSFWAITRHIDVRANPCCGREAVGWWLDLPNTWISRISGELYRENLRLETWHFVGFTRGIPPRTALDPSSLAALQSERKMWQQLAQPEILSTARWSPIDDCGAVFENLRWRSRRMLQNYETVWAAWHVSRVVESNKLSIESSEREWMDVKRCRVKIPTA